MLYVKNVIFMIYKVWIFDRNVLERKKKKFMICFFWFLRLEEGKKIWVLWNVFWVLFVGRFVEDWVIIG